MRYFILTLLCVGTVCAQDAEAAASAAPPQWKATYGDVTTTNETRGNWYFKQRIVKRARELYDKVRSQLSEIEGMQEAFLAQQNDLSSRIHDFYQKAGISQGIIQERLESISVSLEEERKEGALDADEQVLVSKFEEQKKELEQLLRDVEAISKLEGAIDSAIKMVNEQIDGIRDYEQQAWKHYTTISEVLNDETAEKEYYAMQTAYNNVIESKAYISESLQNYLQQSVKAIQEQMKRIIDRLQVLKEKGIELRENIQQEEKGQKLQRLKLLKKMLRQHGGIIQLFG